MTDTEGRTVLEICAGGGGQALGLEAAGFHLAGAIEIDSHCCDTLRHNRPPWNVIQADVREVSGADFRGVDLVAGGVPCPPFSIAGKQLGAGDERDLFPEALRIIQEARPPAVLLENVPGFATAKFVEYRKHLLSSLARLGYSAEWRIINACNFGVPQLRPRFILVGLSGRCPHSFMWPTPVPLQTTVGTLLLPLMASRGWSGAEGWATKANQIAPTIVGGSKKHGGPDLGPTRARRQWATLQVDGLSIADEAPGKECPPDHAPRLTTRMVARLQGFPDSWEFVGKKTVAYRQVGNAFPPPVAMAVGSSIFEALAGGNRDESRLVLDETRTPLPVAG